MIATSALDGDGVENVLPMTERVFEKWTSRVQTSVLNQWLAEVQASRACPMVNGRRTKMKFIVQPKARPPTFRIFANAAEKDIPEVSVNEPCILGASAANSGVFTNAAKKPHLQLPILASALHQVFEERDEKELRDGGNGHQDLLLKHCRRQSLCG